MGQTCCIANASLSFSDFVCAEFLLAAISPPLMDIWAVSNFPLKGTALQCRGEHASLPMSEEIFPPRSYLGMQASDQGAFELCVG